jgi:hypothetical protein
VVVVVVMVMVVVMVVVVVVSVFERLPAGLFTKERVRVFLLYALVP